MEEIELKVSEEEYTTTTSTSAEKLQTMGKKILLEKFNACDPKTVLDVLSSFASTVQIKDASKIWSNSKDTLVLKFKSTKDAENAVSLALKLKDCGADEINIKHFSNGKKMAMYMRFWWD